MKRIPIKTIVNAINVNDFQSKKDKSLLKRLNLSSEKMFIGTIGNFTKPKNFKMFIEVCAELSKKFDYLHFIAVGHSISKKNYEEIVDKRNLGKKISFYDKSLRSKRLPKIVKFNKSYLKNVDLIFEFCCWVIF